ncbi:MAG: hypothetical protein OXU61_05670, partial [Gammaproteobacteria bacterium]|nr:hypothetical protein [Gammaproteobacteria bacterium]
GVTGGAAVGAFSGIGELRGSATATTDRLTGLGAAASWTLGASDSYASADSGGMTRMLAFSNIEALQGGSMADAFTVSAAHTGALMGGAGADTFNLNAALTGTANGEGGADTFALGASGSATALDGGADMDVLQGRDAAAVWTVGATAIGYAAGGAMQTLPAFSDIEVLRGGMLADTFIVSGARSLRLEGGAGADVFTLTAALTGSLSGEGGADRFNLDMGGSVSGGIAGGMGADTFDFNGGTVTGTVAGGAGADVLDFADSTMAVSVTLSGTPDADGFGGGVTGGATVGAFSGIGELRGGPATTDRLTGLGAAASWTVGAADRYASGGQTLAFGGIEELQGGSAADAFTVNGAHTGDLRGGAGADTFTVEAALTGGLSGEGGADTFNLNPGGGVSGAIGGGLGADRFRLEGDYSGASLRGEAGADRFLVSAAGRARLLDGGADADTLELPEGGAGFARAVLVTPTLGRVYGFRDGASIGRYIGSFQDFESVSSPDLETYLLARPDMPGAALEIAAPSLAGSLSGTAPAPEARTFHGEGALESLSLPDLSRFAGPVFLGGMIPEAVPETALPRVSDPALASAADGRGVETGRLRLTGALWTPGRLVLLARQVILDGDLAAGASSPDLRRAAGSGGNLSIFAVGGAEADGDIAPAPEGGQRSLYAGNALIVAAGRFLRPGSTVIELGPSGQLRFAQSADEDPAFHPRSRFFGGGLDVAAQRAVAALGLSGTVREFADLVNQPAVAAEVFLPIDRSVGGADPAGAGSGSLAGNLERLDAAPGPGQPLTVQDPGDAPGAAAPEGSLVVDVAMVVLLTDRSSLAAEDLRRLTGAVERVVEGLGQLEGAGDGAAGPSELGARFLRYQQAIGQYFKRLSALFIDPSLFEESIQLFTTIGKGLALYLSQCEEWEGCVPPLELEELEGLIAKVERALSTASPDQAPQYRRVLQDYRQLREEYIEYLEGEEDDALAARGAATPPLRVASRGAFAAPSPRRR